MKDGDTSPELAWSDLPFAAGREIAAILRSGLLAMSGRPTWRADTPIPGQPPVLLIHGYFGNAAQMGPIGQALLDAGVPRVVAVRYPSIIMPFEGVIDTIASEALSLYRAYGPIDVVGHSLGALAAQAWIKAYDGAHVVRRFVSLSGPHQGTAWHRLVPSPVGRAMNPNGRWITQLRQGNEPVPTTVIRARWDHQVVPPTRARIQDAREIVVPAAGHTGLLWSRAALDAVVATLTAPDPPSES